MKKKYEYEFFNGTEEITLTKRWYDILKDFDRLESNGDRKERYHCWHLDMIRYEGLCYGYEDEYFEWDFDMTPAFEYAYKHLTPMYKVILYRRIINGEMFKTIGLTYETSASAIFHCYEKARKRFIHFYKEGLWLFSTENKRSSEFEKIVCIPYGLTPQQVEKIMEYRKEFKSIREITDLMKIPQNRVKQFVKENPLCESRCLLCGNTIKQSAGKPLKRFCNSECYSKYFRVHGMSDEERLLGTHRKTFLADDEKQVINFYRQHFIPIHEIRKLTGCSKMRIASYCYSFPLPYTECLNCGTKIYYANGDRIAKYCSDKCMTEYNNRIVRKLRTNPKNIDVYTLPTSEQLLKAIKLKESTQKNLKKISKITGVTIEDLELLFRFQDI